MNKWIVRKGIMSGWIVIAPDFWAKDFEQWRDAAYFADYASRHPDGILAPWPPVFPIPSAWTYETFEIRDASGKVSGGYFAPPEIINHLRKKNPD